MKPKAIVTTVTVICVFSLAFIVVERMQLGATSGRGVSFRTSSQSAAFPRPGTGTLPPALLNPGSRPSQVASLPHLPPIVKPVPVTSLTAIGGDKVVLLQWPPASEKQVEYIVSRATTKGGPYTQLNGRLLTGCAYLDDNTGSGLMNGTTYYYVVKSLDRSYNPGEQSAEIACTPAEQPGLWGMSIEATGTSPEREGASKDAGAFGNYKRTSVGVAAILRGEAQAGNVETAKGSYSGIWTATWCGNGNKAMPGLYIVDETKANNAEFMTQGSGGIAKVVSATGTIAERTRSSSNSPLEYLPDIPPTVAETDAGHVVFTYDRIEHSRLQQPVTERHSARVDRYNHTTHIVHVYTPAYFKLHYADPSMIAIVYPVANNIVATAKLPSHAGKGDAMFASGDVSDEYCTYAPWSN